RGAVVPLRRSTAGDDADCSVSLEDSATGVAGLRERIALGRLDGESMHPAAADGHVVEWRLLMRDDLTLSQTGRATGLLHGSFSVSSDLGNVGGELCSKIVFTGGRPVGHSGLDV